MLACVAAVLAYYLTWTTYGTWLRGDGRGWTEVGERGGARFVEPDPALAEADQGRLKQAPFILGVEARRAVERAIRDGCEHRGWRLHVLSVRSNHVHVVVSASKEIERAMTDMKAWGTRGLREEGLVGADAKVWTRHGSTRYIDSDASLASAVDYVGRLQDHPGRWRREAWM